MSSSPLRRGIGNAALLASSSTSGTADPWVSRSARKQASVAVVACELPLERPHRCRVVIGQRGQRFARRFQGLPTHVYGRFVPRRDRDSEFAFGVWALDAVLSRK